MRENKIYKKIAKKYGVTPEEVKRDMQYAINYAWTTNPSAQNYSTSAPTITQFIDIVKKQTNNKL